MESHYLLALPTRTNGFLHWKETEGNRKRALHGFSWPWQSEKVGAEMPGSLESVSVTKSGQNGNK